MVDWLKIARRPEIVIRSLKIAAVVGTILALINYLDVILAGALKSGDVFKIMLTYLVPYCVSTYAAVGTVLNQREK